jgi:MoaA/NifB/PqqE/SkfB family radical SAM enzyme
MGRLASIYPRLIPPRPRLTPRRKKLGLFRSWISGHPMWLSWQVTYRCNMKCTFCQYWQHPSRPQDELTLDGFREGSERLARLGAILTSLAGGEPLIRPDIVDIVETVGRYHFPFITTNGWNATPELARELFRADCWGVSVSLDYADCERHDTARGRAGAFERAMAAIEAFGNTPRQPWQRVNVMGVLFDDNLGEIEKLLKLALKFDSYFMVQPYSELKTGSEKFTPRRPVSAELLRLRRQYPNFLSNPGFLGQFDRFFATGQVPGCKAGRAFWNIDERGDVAMCVENRDKPVGNLLTVDPQELVRRLKVESHKNTCNNCWYNCRGETECLYNFGHLIKSLPTYIFNRGRPSLQPSSSKSART